MRVTAGACPVWLCVWVSLLAPLAVSAESTPAGLCRTALLSAYRNASLPSNFRQLCGTQSDPRSAWLATIKFNETLGRERLHDLLLVADDLDRAIVPNPLRAERLPPILAETIQTTTPALTWLERLWRWLTRNASDEALDLTWLWDLLERHAPPTAVLDALVRVTVVLILVCALYVVLRGVDIKRRARWRWQRRPGVRPTNPSAVFSGDPAASWDSVLATTPGARPAALLRWLLNALTQAGIIPRNPALTGRELAAGLQSVRPELSPAFSAVIDDIESCLFSGRDALTAAALEQLGTRVDTLIRQASRS